jgi:hypothetical protein
MLVYPLVKNGAWSWLRLDNGRDIGWGSPFSKYVTCWWRVWHGSVEGANEWGSLVPVTLVVDKKMKHAKLSVMWHWSCQNHMCENWLEGQHSVYGDLWICSDTLKYVLFHNSMCRFIICRVIWTWRVWWTHVGWWMTASSFWGNRVNDTRVI